MSEEKLNLLPNYLDVQTWLLKLGMQDNLKLLEITHKAINKTAEQFNIPYEKVEELIQRRELAQSKEEVPIVIFYFEYFRKIRDSLE